MKGGKREGSGRTPSAKPLSSIITFRTTPEQAEKLKSLGGGDWVRQKIDIAKKKSAHIATAA